MGLLALLAGTQIREMVLTLQHGVVGDVKYYCSTSVNEFSCTVTNLMQNEVLGICLGGKLAPKGSRGVAAETMPVCTGSMPARSSVHLTVHWAKGSPATACPGEGILGVNWDVCELAVNEVP